MRLQPLTRSVKSAISVICAAQLLAVSSATEPKQASNGVRNVAIIGAGAAGASTAYYLRKYAEEYDLSINITVFERTDKIGGRTLTVQPFDISGPSESVELGASIFIKLNAILYNATLDFGLDTTTREDDGIGGILAFWDGDHIRFDIDDSHSKWRTSARLVWRYGFFALKNSQALVQKTVAKFLNLYEPPYFPFKSLTQRTYELELLEETSLTGEEFLRKNKIPDLLSHEFIQALTRVNYASNLAHIHGLETMVSTAPEGAMSVVGGNWRIFEKMIQASLATLLSNTSVASIDLEKKDPAYPTPKYILKTQSSSDYSALEQTQDVAFDDVVVATPYQFSKISTTEGLLEKIIEEIPYIKLHVTIFSSPFQLSATYFKVTPSKVPTTVLTTLADGESPLDGVQGAGKAGFYSISTLSRVLHPKTGTTEYLYKIFSPEKVTPEFLSALLGVKVPDNFIGKTDTDDTNAQAVEPISWYYPHVFNSYPKGFPRVTFQDPVIGDGLYYTSGMESFISTMETSALMGKNVARLIVDNILGVDTEKAVFVEKLGAKLEQSVLQEL